MLPEVPIEAMPELLLAHIPEGVPSLATVVLPIQTEIEEGEMGATAGPAFTVTGVITKQPDGNVNVIVAEPVPTPVNTPDGSIDPTEPSLLVQVPLPDGSPSVVVAPTQILVVPVMAEGFGLTVTTAVVTQPDGDV
jgi:hypothetical protein